MFCAALRRSGVAWLLLLCLGRTLLPETWLLAWHPHAHTTEEPAFAARRGRGPQKLLLGSRHQHCHAEQFYDVPFAIAGAVVVAWPLRRACYVAPAGVAVLAGQSAREYRTTPRGPPAGQLLQLA